MLKKAREYRFFIAMCLAYVFRRWRHNKCREMRSGFWIYSYL